MRALVIFAVVVITLVAVFRFQDPPSPGQEAIPMIATAEARFLTRSSSEASANPVPSGAATAETESAVRPFDAAPAWVGPSLQHSGADAAEVAIAAVVAHGSAEEVESALALHPDFPATRGKLALAFSWALSGDPQRGMSFVAGIPDSTIDSREKVLLRAALGGGFQAVRPRNAAAIGAPLALAMELALTVNEGKKLLETGKHAEAARAFSDVLLEEISAPWGADPQALGRWSRFLDAVQAHHRWSASGDWPGEEIEVKSGDSAIAIRKRYLARRPGRIMCAGLILRANGVTGYLQPGQKLRVPTDDVSVLVDLSASWAFFMMGDEVAGSWPVGIGRPGEETPIGMFVAREKTENPPWMKIGQEPIPFGDPRNPLGSRWIAWWKDGVKTSYGFHGTREPESIGRPASDGCVRFRNEDVEVLFDILPEGAPIRVQS